jgi:hypothetical protein
MFFLCPSLLFFLLFILSLPLRFFCLLSQPLLFLFHLLPASLLIFESFTLAFGNNFLLDSKALGFGF